jgi:hypothetical protein
MARQEDACWRCGTDWATEERPRTGLRVIPGGMATRAAEDPPQTAIAATMNGSVRAATAAHMEADRWTDEGGHL